MCSADQAGDLRRRVAGRHGVGHDVADDLLLLLGDLADLVHPVLVEEGSYPAVALADVDLEPGVVGLLQLCNGLLHDREISRRAAGGLHDGEQPVKSND